MKFNNEITNGLFLNFAHFFALQNSLFLIDLLFIKLSKHIFSFVFILLIFETILVCLNSSQLQCSCFKYISFGWPFNLKKKFFNIQQTLPIFLKMCHNCFHQLFSACERVYIYLIYAPINTVKFIFFRYIIIFNFMTNK